MFSLFLFWLAGFIVCYTWMSTDLFEAGIPTCARDVGRALLWPVVVVYHWHAILQKSK